MDDGAATVRDVIAALQEQRFVGRDDEVRVFRGALTSSDPTPAVMFVHGPGGIGKTSLLAEFARIAGDAGVPVVRVDGRDVDPSPTALRDAIQPLQSVTRGVLLVDGYERLGDLDEWMRTGILPDLPVGVRAVVAGRQAPSPAWRSDAGWQDLLLVLPLRNLTPEDSREYLHGCGVEHRLHEKIIDLTYGHPLALSLLADSVMRNDEQPDAALAPDLVSTLINRFVDSVPSPDHLRALEVSALARVTTEALLREALDVPDAHQLFAWLEGLSFFERSPEGVVPHDLAREALAADLHRRDPDAYEAVFRGIRTHIIRRLKATRGRAQQRVLLDAKYMHRHQPVSRGFTDWETFGQYHLEPARGADGPEIVGLVRTWEGESSALIAERWMRLQPEGFWVVRDHDGSVRGCLAVIDLTRAKGADVASDPGAAAALEYARTHVAIGPGEGVTQWRFIVDRDAYQQPSPTTNLGPVASIQHWLTTAGLAASFLTFADADAWQDYFAFFEILRAEDADFEVDDHQFGLFVRDFTRIGIDDWLALMFERDLAGDFVPLPDAHRPEVLALSEVMFETAVRQALRDLRRPDLLAENPLTRSWLVLSRRGADDAAATLATLLRDAVEAVRDDPRDEKLYRVLDRTYLRPAGSQENAADLLGLPISTYKRHLRRGVERVVRHLWRHDLTAADGEDLTVRAGSSSPG